MFDRSDDVADVLSFHDFQVRGTVNDLLGADLSPKLYPALFNQITASLSTCFSSAGEVYPSHYWIPNNKTRSKSKGIIRNFTFPIICNFFFYQSTRILIRTEQQTSYALPDLIRSVYNKYH